MILNIINKLALIISIFFLISCSSLPRNPESWMESEKNACLPTAISFKKALERQQIWARVLRYTYLDNKTKKKSGHAITVYLYPPGKNQLWSYDYLGSYRIRAFIDNAYQIAFESIKVRGYWYYSLEYAEFLD